jgi:hypothetical protein
MGSRSAAAVSDEEISNADKDIRIPIKSYKRRAGNSLEESEMEPTLEPKAEEEVKATQHDGTGAAEGEEEGEEEGDGV